MRAVCPERTEAGVESWGTGSQQNKQASNVARSSRGGAFGRGVCMRSPEERPAQDLSQVVALAGTSACPPMSQLHGEGFTCGDWLTMPHRTVVPCSGKSSCERSCFDTEWCSNWFINRAGTLCALAGPGRCKPSVDSDWTFYGVARDCSLTKAPITSRTRTCDRGQQREATILLAERLTQQWFCDKPLSRFSTHR